MQARASCARVSELPMTWSDSHNDWTLPAGFVQPYSHDLTCREAALLYVASGLPVLPLRPRGKVPLTAHAYLDASVDCNQVRAWWSRWPAANIGIPTGEVSGFDVLDVDPRHGGMESLAALEREFGGLPPTLTADTGSGGAHYLLRHDPRARRAVGFRPGLDYLATGGHFVAAPSIHPCGVPYRWRSGVTRIAEPPPWLIAELGAAKRPAVRSTRFRAPPLPAGSRGTSYGQGALRRQSLAVSQTPQGSRNHALNAAAYCLGRLVAAGHLPAEEVMSRLLAASEANGYLGEVGERAVCRVIACGMTAGFCAGPTGPTLPWAGKEVAR